MFISGHFRLLGMWKTRKYISWVAIWKARAASVQSFTAWHWQQATTEITRREHYYCLFVPHIFVCCSPFMVNRTFNTMPTEKLQQHPLLFVMNRTARTSFYEGCTWHDLHILVTAPHSCDRKTRATSVQSFTLWQQATIEITRRAHSIIACSRHIYMGVVLHAHLVRDESHIQHNPTERLQHLQQGWARLVEMSESERDKLNANCFHKKTSI